MDDSDADEDATTTKKRAKTAERTGEEVDRVSEETGEDKVEADARDKTNESIRAEEGHGEESAIDGGLSYEFDFPDWQPGF